MNRLRRNETIVYLCLWLLAIALYIIDEMRSRANSDVPLFEIDIVLRMVRVMLPFFVLFMVNNLVLIPKLLFRNKYPLYFLSASAALVVLWVFQYFSFERHIAMFPPMLPVPDMRPLLPLPLLLDFTYGIMIVGVNLAIALMFLRYDDRLESERLKKANAEAELAYLKAQINPHFYMNMLNNIHGMIEIDSERAQSMVIEMSHLMRYMLYDSSKPSISLMSEIDFLANYLALMRQRFPSDKVAITSSFPERDEIAGVSLPPLLFLVFIENAFKHGVSYRDKSFVAVSIEISRGQLHFTCINSVHSHEQSAKESSGIGLRNISQRLALLYGGASNLTVNNTDTTYTVNLNIPLNETKNRNY